MMTSKAKLSGLQGSAVDSIKLGSASNKFELYEAGCRILNLNHNDIMAMEFDSELEAQAFCKNYALDNGFALSSGDVDWNETREMIW